MKAQQLRQGDLLFVRVKAAQRAKAHEPILARGEATGHAHQVAPADLDNCEVFLDAVGRLVVRVKRGKRARVVHEEHGAIVLDPGTWEVRRQREYAPNYLRQVAD